jgi:hypothetical protein
MKGMILVLLFGLLMGLGCSARNKPELLIKPVKAHAVDANQNGLHDDNDVFILYEHSDKVYNDKIVPYMQKAGIGSKTELGSPNAMLKIRGALTVTEFDIFMQNMAEYNLINSQIEATAKAFVERKLEPKSLPVKSEKALGSHVWGQIELASGIVIKYGGIRIPVGATDNRYARVVSVLSNKYIAGRLIRYSLTGVKVGNVSEAYIYVGKLFINEELVKEGYALAVRDNSDKADILIKAEEEARAKKKGLWQYENPFPPESLY